MDIELQYEDRNEILLYGVPREYHRPGIIFLSRCSPHPSPRWLYLNQFSRAWYTVHRANLRVVIYDRLSFFVFDLTGGRVGHPITLVLSQGAREA